MLENIFFPIADHGPTAPKEIAKAALGTTSRNPSPLDPAPNCRESPFSGQKAQPIRGGDRRKIVPRRQKNSRPSLCPPGSADQDGAKINIIRAGRTGGEQIVYGGKCGATVLLRKGGVRSISLWPKVVPPQSRLQRPRHCRQRRLFQPCRRQAHG